MPVGPGGSPPAVMEAHPSLALGQVWDLLEKAVLSRPGEGGVPLGQGREGSSLHGSENWELGLQSSLGKWPRAGVGEGLGQGRGSLGLG